MQTTSVISKYHFSSNSDMTWSDAQYMMRCLLESEGRDSLITASEAEKLARAGKQLFELIKMISVDAVISKKCDLIGWDIFVNLLRIKADVLVKCWGPTKFVVGGGKAEHVMMRLGLDIPYANFLPAPRFVVGLTMAGYTPVLIRGGISSGCEGDNDNTATDEVSRQADYDVHLESLAGTVNLTKRTITVSYKRMNRFLYDSRRSQLREGDVEGARKLQNDLMMTKLEEAIDLHIRTIAARNNLEQLGQPLTLEESAAASAAPPSSKSEALVFPLERQKSFGGFELNNFTKATTQQTGYATWDIKLPRCADAPDQNSCDVIAEGGKPIVGPHSAYNPDLIVLDSAHAAKNNEKIKKKADHLQSQRNRQQQRGNNGHNAASNMSGGNSDSKKTTKTPAAVTRFSHVLAPLDSTSAVCKTMPEIEPVKDLRPFTNLTFDYVVPAIIISQGPTEVSSALDLWKCRMMAYELIMYDPVYMPLSNAESREAARIAASELPTVLPDSDQVYANLASHPDILGLEFPSTGMFEIGYTNSPNNQSAGENGASPNVNEVIEDQDTASSRKRPHSSIQIHEEDESEESVSTMHKMLDQIEASSTVAPNDEHTIDSEARVSDARNEVDISVFED